MNQCIESGDAEVMGVNLSWIEDGLAVLLRHENIITCLVQPEAEFMNVQYL